MSFEFSVMKVISDLVENCLDMFIGKSFLKELKNCSFPSNVICSCTFVLIVKLPQINFNEEVNTPLLRKQT